MRSIVDCLCFGGFYNTLVRIFGITVNHVKQINYNSFEEILTSSQGKCPIHKQ